MLGIAVLGLGTSTGGGAASSSTTFVAVADGYVVGGTSNQNNGTATTLKIKPSFPAETAYLKFTVSGLAGAAVQSATLRVNAISGLNWGFDAYTTASGWTETGLTYQNAPAPATKLGSFPSGNLTGWISLDVTPAISTDGTYSFALVGTYWQELSLAAREAGATAPQLVITTNGTPDTQAPTPPSNLAVTNTTPTTLSLAWAASTDDTAVSGYNLYLGTTKVGTATSSPSTYTGLACATAYTLGVEAYDAAGNTSTRSTLTASTGPCPDTQPPTAPSNLAQTANTTTSVSLSWTASTDNTAVAGYSLYLAGTPAGTTTATTTTISNLACGTSYQIGIDAYDTASNHSPQTTTTATTAACPTDTQPPTPPSNLTITNTTTTTITLTWTAATDNTAVTGYNLYRSTTAGFTPVPGNRIAQPTSTGYTDAGLASGTYHYRVTARDAAGNESLASAEVTGTASGGVVTPTPVPAANVAGVTVGPGFVEASARQILRTGSGTVYVITADDDPCQTGGSGVIRVWKGTGAQAANASVPTGFAEQDSAHHPVSAGSGSCVFSGGVTSVLLSPDSRLDAAGTIHTAYIDGKNGNVYYQTFSTVTNTWGPRTTIGTGGQTNSGSGWPRGGQVALSLDSSDVPHVLYATSGTANSLRYTNRVGGSWSTPVVVASGTNVMHPSLVTSLDGTLHAAWLDNSLASHATVRYSHYIVGAWTAPETVSSGDAVVLSNTDDDQGPSIATDPSNRPHVLFMDGTALGANDYVRMRYRTSSGSWVDNTPPGGAGGPSNPAGTWFSHTPQNYVSAAGDDYVFLGHDVNISPGGYQFEVGGPGGSWSAYATIDPRNRTNTTAGAAGLDGSASIRFDPLRDTNPGIIDLLYYDENDGTPGYDHHATLYYKAIVIR